MGQTFAGFVLAGGKSERMQADKAFVDLAGMPLVMKAIEALDSAATITAVGGDEARFRALGVEWIADDEPSAGPLAALQTALNSTSQPRAVILSCDLPRIVPSAIEQLIDGLRFASCSVPMVAGRMQWIAAAWQVRPTLIACDRARADNKNSVHAMAAELDRSVLLATDPRWFEDADTPEELARVSSEGS